MWAPKGGMLAVVSNGALLIGSPTALRRVSAGVQSVPLPAFSPDGRHLAYVRGSIVVRRIADGDAELSVPVRNAQIKSLAWAAGGRLRLVVEAYAQGD